MSTHHKKTEETSATLNVAEALRHVEAAIAALALPTPAVTAKQKRIAAKARKGAEKVLPTITLLANQYGVNLPLQPTSKMSEQFALAKQLEPLQKKLAAFLASIDANAFQASSASWSTATMLYSILKRVAKSDPEARAQLAPVQEFFAFRTPAVRAKSPKQKGKKAALKAAQEQEAPKAGESGAGDASKTPTTSSGAASA